MKYLVNILSFEDLKAKYRELAKELHPDCGGNKEAMQELNNEFELLKPIWENTPPITNTPPISQKKDNSDTEKPKRTFYSPNGWCGDNYKSGRTIKEIAEIIRTYLNEKYSDCKWSVRISSGTWTSSLRVTLLEAPYNVFRGEPKKYYTVNGYRQDKDLCEKANAMFLDIVRTINSYNYNDSDPMTDYFDVGFYFDVDIGKDKHPFKVVYREPKKADDRVYETVVVKQTKTRKVKKAEAIPAPAEYAVGQRFKLKEYFSYGCNRGYVYEINGISNGRIHAIKMERKLTKTVTSIFVRGNTFSCSVDSMSKWLSKDAIEFVNIVDATETYEVEKTVKRPIKPDVAVDSAPQIGKYTVTEDVDTRDQSKIWIVKWAETLDREAYKALAAKMKELGGYYSRFKKGFLFKEDPAEKLNEAFV